MASLSRAESKRLYSWWWDSHLSPQNSKWLQEDLTDMDAKVKLMIKLIEEDAETFAKRAEMFYEKRPELINLVEEFYRAYRALAERYDHAVGDLRRTHRSMEETFPDHVPSEMADVSPTGSSHTEYEQHTPELSFPLPIPIKPEESHKDAMGFSPSKLHVFKRTGSCSIESDSPSRKGLKQLDELFGPGEDAAHHVKFAEAWMTKGLDFHGEDKKGFDYGAHNESRNHPNYMEEEKGRVLQDSMLDLGEEDQRRKKEFEEEQDKSVRAQLEIFILQTCIRDMKDRNLSLLIECQEHFEASMLSEKFVTKLKQENSEQQVKIKSLLNQVERLRLGISQLFALKTTPDHVCEGKVEEDEILIQQVLGKVKALESYLLEAHDEKQQVLFENSVHLTLLGQMRLDLLNLTSERNTLTRDIKIRTEQLLLQQTENRDLLEMNEKLRLEVGSKEQQQKVLMAEMENQCTRLSALQEMYPLLQNENSKLLEANMSLMNEVLGLKKVNCKLEEEISVILREVMNLGNLSIVSNRFGAEKAVEIKELCKDLDHLRVVNNGLLKEVREEGKRLKMVETENTCHKESVEKLRNEVNTLRNSSVQLNHRIEIGQDLLNRKEVELSEAKEKLKAAESKNMELHRLLEELKMDYDEIRMMRGVLEKQVLNISEGSTQKNKEIRCLHEANELGGSCESLEDDTSKCVDIVHLKEKFYVLEREHEGMQSAMDAYFAVLGSLRDSVTSLEDCVSLETKNTDSQETKVSSVEGHLYDNSYQKMTKNPIPMMTDGVSALLELQTRVKAIENLMMEKRRSDTNIKLEAAMKGIREFQPKTSSDREEDVKANREVVMQLEQEKLGDECSKLESSEMVNEVSVKDIPLDQVSQCSSYDRGFGLNLIIGRGIGETDGEMIEFWEPVEHDQNPNLTYQAPQGNTSFHQIEGVEEQKSEHPLSEWQYEKYLGVDKLVVSRRVTGLNPEENKMLERVASDLQKLRSLQITVEDLKWQMEKLEKNKKASKGKMAKDIEYTKKELKEVDEAVMQLVSVNEKLTKSITKLPFVPYGKDILGLEEIEKAQRPSVVSKQMQQRAEIIGRLQLEVQRIQFVLVRLGAGRNTEGSKVVNREVLLRDYLYGHERSHAGRRKGLFRACIRPLTSNDVETR